MRTRTPGGTRVQHPRRRLKVFDEPMAMAVDDRTDFGEAGAQQPMPIPRRHLMTVNHRELAAGQRLLDPFRQVDQQLAVLLRPLAGDIIVAKDGEHAPKPGLQLREDGRATDVATVHGQIAPGNDLLDTRVDRPVSIRKERNPHLCHGCDLFQKNLFFAVRRTQSMVSASLPVTCPCSIS